jgi:uncharacterized RDD family membrane protein YckC
VGGWADHAQPAATPTITQSLAYAGAGVRFIALLIDLVALVILLFAAGLILGIIEVATGSTGSLGQSTTEAVIAQALFTILSFAYFTLGWVQMRSTLGQRLLRIQVGRAADGASLTWGQASVRWLLLTLGPLGVIAAAASETVAGIVGLLALGWWIALLVSTIVDPLNRGFHDRLSNALVVQRVKQVI